MAGDFAMTDRGSTGCGKATKLSRGSLADFALYHSARMLRQMELFEMAFVIGGTLIACVGVAAYLGWRI